MLKLRDISLKKRILLTNFLMIALPVGFLLVLGGLLFAGLKTTGTLRDAELALLWQDKREALSIQLAVSSLKAKADSGKKVSEMEADCRALERWGIDSLIAKNGETVYASPGADPQELLQDVQMIADGSRSFLRWDERGLALLYRAEKTRTVVIARSRIPFHARAPKEEDPLHDVWEILAYIFLAGISHDLATPLTAIKGYASGILDGIAFSKDKLFYRIWGMNALGDTATVMVHINRIREKIEPNPTTPIYIETVWGVGYRFQGGEHKG